MNTSKELLIVDDDEHVRTYIKEIVNINLPSLNVKELGDSRKVINKVLNNKPDLILLDIMMPHMNGLEILKKLKEDMDKDINKIPVIILTAVHSREINLQTKKLGAEDYILKPFNEKVLLLKIKRLLKLI